MNKGPCPPGPGVVTPEAATYTGLKNSFTTGHRCPTTVMRPLFAIAPLALLLVLIGPTPHEANQALANIKSYFMPTKVPARAERSRELAAAKPSMSKHNAGVSMMQTSSNIDTGVRH